MTIDWWTLGLETINVAVLIWLLGRFFWRPVAAGIEARRLEAARILGEAQASREQAAAALADISKTREGFAKERETLLAAARSEAEREAATALAAARRRASEIESGARTAVEAARLATEQEWAARSGRLAVDIARKLMARLDGPAVRAAFADWLVDTIRTLPPELRASAAAAPVIEATSATPLDTQEQDRIRDRISHAIGAAPTIVFKTDPSLIAGLELGGPHLVVANSWRADLERILREIGHG